MNEQELIKKLVDSLISLTNQAEIDKLLFGNAYWEITDRKIELIDPTKVKVKKGMTIVSNQSSRHKHYGKSIIKPLNIMKGGYKI